MDGAIPEGSAEGAFLSFLFTQRPQGPQPQNYGRTGFPRGFTHCLVAFVIMQLSLGPSSPRIQTQSQCLHSVNNEGDDIRQSCTTTTAYPTFQQNRLRKAPIHLRLTTRINRENGLAPCIGERHALLMRPCYNNQTAYSKACSKDRDEQPFTGVPSPYPTVFQVPVPGSHWAADAEQGPSGDRL